jgi:hypothetical protein
MAFASSAQALNPMYLINKKLVPSGLNAQVTGTLEPETIARLLIPALNTEINCTGFTVQEGVILDEEVAHGKLLYEGCTVLVESTKAEAFGCEVVVNHAGDNKHHITATFLMLPAELKNGDPALLAEKIVANVLTKEGTGCVLPKTTLIKGEVCLKIALGTNDTVEPLILSDNTIQGECRERTTLESLLGEVASGGFKDKLLFGINEAFVDFKATLKLAGLHNGLTLGVSLQ